MVLKIKGVHRVDFIGFKSSRVVHFSSYVTSNDFKFVPFLFQLLTGCSRFKWPKHLNWSRSSSSETSRQFDYWPHDNFSTNRDLLQSQVKGKISNLSFEIMFVASWSKMAWRLCHSHLGISNLSASSRKDHGPLAPSLNSLWFCKSWYTQYVT